MNAFASPSSPFPSRAEMESLDCRTDRQKLCAEIMLRTNINLFDAPSWGEDDLLNLLVDLWDRAEPGEVLRVNRKEPAAAMAPSSTFRANSRLADAVGLTDEALPGREATEFRRVQAEREQLHAMRANSPMQRLRVNIADDDDEMLAAMIPKGSFVANPNDRVQQALAPPSSRRFNIERL